MLSTHDPLAVVVDLITAVSLAPDRLEDRVDALVDILIPEMRATVGLLVRADVTHLDVQVLGGALLPGAQSVMCQQLRHQLRDPLLAPIVAGDLRPTSAERAFGRQAWQTSRTRLNCMIAFGVDQLATLPVHGGQDLVTFLVGRPSPDFSDEEIALLCAVQPAVSGLGTLMRLPRNAPEHMATISDMGHRLTDREIEVLSLLAHGHKAAVIGRMAGCSTRTVHRHLGHIYDKLDVSDRLSAVNRAHELGVIHSDVIHSDLIDIPLAQA